MRAHFLREYVYSLKQGRVFEILHDLLTIFDRLDPAQAAIKEGL
ncbi:MAG: hypothetical protein WB662_07960 [Methyloceanibacter sp.]